MTGTRIAREEIFGPVLSVRAVSDLDDAMARLNDTAYSLSASIYVRDVHSAFSGIQELDTGIVYINAPTIGAKCHFPFGETRDTGNGRREGAHPVYDVWNTIYVDYSGQLQRAQIDHRAEEER